MLRVAIVVLLVSAAPAIADDSTIRRALDHYAETAGKLTACGRGPGADAVESHADMIARWQRPGIWARLTGARAEYRDDLLASADRAFLLAAAEGCTIAPLFDGYEYILRTTGDMIERHVSD